MEKEIVMQMMQKLMDQMERYTLAHMRQAKALERLAHCAERHVKGWIDETTPGGKTFSSVEEKLNADADADAA